LLSVAAPRLLTFAAAMDATVECPYCGEPGQIEEEVDNSEPGDQVFIQDCEVCCRPWTVSIRIDHDGEVTLAVDRA
jgi:hypothetical protein